MKLFNKFKISKGGYKMERGEYGWHISQNLALATFITPSLREILKTFGKNIIVLKGFSEKIEKNFNETDIGGFNFLKIKRKPRKPWETGSRGLGRWEGSPKLF